jgi:hypothetical protein
MNTIKNAEDFSEIKNEINTLSVAASQNLLKLNNPEVRGVMMTDFREPNEQFRFPQVKLTFSLSSGKSATAFLSPAAAVELLWFFTNAKR